MRATRVKQLRSELLKFIPAPTKQQWRRYKKNYMLGLL